MIPKLQDEQSSPKTDGISVIDDCDNIPPTVILNRQLIVDYKYAYFHHDDHDIDQNSFIDGNHSDPNVLCAGDECDNK